MLVLMLVLYLSFMLYNFHRVLNIVVHVFIIRNLIRTVWLCCNSSKTQLSATAVKLSSPAMFLSRYFRWNSYGIPENSQNNILPVVRYDYSSQLHLELYTLEFWMFIFFIKLCYMMKCFWSLIWIRWLFIHKVVLP